MDDSLASFLRLDGRRILLTGATGYLGSVMAESLTQGGAEILLAGRSFSSLTALAERLNNLNGNICAYPMILDIANEESRRSLANLIKTEYKDLHGIVNNAYSGRVGGLEFINPEDFSTACTQNIGGPFHLIQLLLDVLETSASQLQGGGAIVNIASMYGLVSPDHRIYPNKQACNPVHYGASKAGMIQMTRYLACHLAELNIRVNSVSPGACPAPQVAINNPEFITTLETKIPLNRVGQAQEIAYPVHFLLSPAASYITGANLIVDGGWTAW